jgi:hypothetical protein
MAKVRITSAFFMVCVLSLLATRPARAQAFFTHDTAKIVGITVGLAGVGAVIGIGVYAAAHRNHRLTGCALAGTGGLELWSPGEQQTYALIGELSAVKPGERVRVSGKKSKQNQGTKRQFLVEKLEKDFGACGVEHAER